MKKIFSLAVVLVLLYSMLLTAIPASAVTVGPYTFEAGCIQSIETPSSVTLGNGKANYYKTKVTSRMQNEANREQTYETHVVIGTKNAKFFAYSAESTDKNGYGLKTVLEIAKDFEKENPDYEVIAAINGDFFNTKTGEPESPMIQNGEMLKSYIHTDMIGRGMVGIDDTTGKIVYHTIGDAYEKAGYGTDFVYDGDYQIQVIGENNEISASYKSVLASAPTSTELSFTTSDYGKGAYEGKTVYVLELERYRKDTGSHNTNASTDKYYYAYGKITEIISGTSNMKPEAGKAYIAASSDSQAPALKVGAYVKCQKALTGAWENVSSAIGFKQQLLANGITIFTNMYSRYHHSLSGGSGNYGEAAGYNCSCNPNMLETAKWTEDLYDYPMCWKNRTAIGFKSNGSVVFMTVAKSDGDKWGATYVELASQLKALGCSDGFLLDGGGSSTMVIRQNGQLTTVFKGEEGTAGQGRVVGNVAILAVPKEAPVNRQPLNDAIAKAEAFKKDDYTATASDWSTLATCLDEAKMLVADETATQEWIDLALEGLNDAIAVIEKTKKPAPAETQAPATDAPKATDATDENNNVNEPVTDNTGCGSSISLAAIVTVGAIGTTLVIKKKRKSK